MFNDLDMATLEAVRFDAEAASMDNPIGGIRRGWGPIAVGYSTVRRRRM
ncbi:hypothetical protein J2W42_004368 [Rhizobium tibeticum]|nr:hypothetical protein [Rhizobium tibeticum]MDP9811504.1 hypothetical protein [Rhizobium tibeticum]